jgi:peptidoglycan/xylan/chitin deacetylase (PgdA/CDA1 family)
MPHGLMFHHFHDDSFAPSQGSISAETLARVIAHYRDSHNLLDAGEFKLRALDGSLTAGDVCLTFDDSLLCQYRIAYPVLQDYGLRAFWFVYSSVIDGNIEVLEVYRRFRNEFFDSIDSFYAAFIDTARKSAYAASVAQRLAEFSPSDYLVEFPFYSDDDRRFRFVRDQVLGPAAYEAVMDQMMDAFGTSRRQLGDGLWMNADHLRTLHRNGHIIGLHSHTHPTALASMPANRQETEYRDNRDLLTRVLGDSPDTMSHPCNSYSDVTLDLLGGLGITLGFRSNMSAGDHSALEFPREDHANIVARLAL